MSTHAKLSPSSAHRWLACPGSVTLSEGIEDAGSDYADEGTAAHWLAAHCLETGLDAFKYLAFGIDVDRSGQCAWHQDKQLEDFSTFFITSDFASAVQVYVDNVREYAVHGELMVEQRMSIEHITGEEGAQGTADAVILIGNNIQAHDLKFGRGEKVDAEENPQLKMYALAALEQFGMLGEFDTVTVVIHQPRLQHLSEWSSTVEELLAWQADVREKAEQIIARELDADLNPGESQCRWCRAKAICPKLHQHVMDEFDAVQDPAGAEEDLLAHAMGQVGLIEDWCKAVRAETERRLLAGTPIDGWKLVEGRRGTRQWTSKEEAEETLKAMRVKRDDMYDFTVISPTTAEKLAKAGTLGEKQWARLQQIITQSEGKPSVAPATDKRPALVVTAVADDFAVEEDDLADLLGADLVGGA